MYRYPILNVGLLKIVFKKISSNTGTGLTVRLCVDPDLEGSRFSSLPESRSGIRIRIQNLDSESGSGYMNPDPDPC